MAYSYGGGASGAVSYLQSLGLLDLIVPFLLFFAVFFAILQKVNLFATKKEGAAAATPDKRINSVVALGLSLSIVLPHAAGLFPLQYDPIVLLNSILPGAGMTIIVALLAVLLVGFIAGGEQLPNVLTGLIGIGSIIVLIAITIYAVSPYSLPFEFLRDPAIQSVLVVVIVLALVVWFVMGKEGGEDWTTKMGKWYKKIP